MSRLPGLLVSHGAPTFALEPGLAGSRLGALGRDLPRPVAVLVVSPHWMTPSPQVSAAAQPATIHDFDGFDPALYEVHYSARGQLCTVCCRWTPASPVLPTLRVDRLPVAARRVAQPGSAESLRNSGFSHHE